jgi:hypothetical protein
MSQLPHIVVKTTEEDIDEDLPRHEDLPLASVDSRGKALAEVRVWTHRDASSLPSALGS